MLSCHSCYICGAWRSRGKGFKVIIWREREKPKRGLFTGGHKKLRQELTPRLVYLNYLPLNSASFGVK